LSGGRGDNNSEEKVMVEIVGSHRPALEHFKMIKSVLTILCLMASYFFVMLILSGYWGQALAYGILGSLVFYITLLSVSVALRAQHWRAFWIANIVLISVFGGIELYAMLTLPDLHATRFGGARLSIGGHITVAGFMSLALDIGICTLSNFIGVYLSRLLIEHFNIE